MVGNDFAYKKWSSDFDLYQIAIILIHIFFRYNAAIGRSRLAVINQNHLLGRQQAFTKDGLIWSDLL